jgi:hypothetical protein
MLPISPITNMRNGCSANAKMPSPFLDAFGRVVLGELGLLYSQQRRSVVASDLLSAVQNLVCHIRLVGIPAKVVRINAISAVARMAGK